VVSKVRRLPTQHKDKPHCPACERDLPTFDNIAISVPVDDFKGATLVHVSFRVRCACGETWDIRKGAKGL